MLLCICVFICLYVYVFMCLRVYVFMFLGISFASTEKNININKQWNQTTTILGLFKIDCLKNKVV